MVSAIFVRSDAVGSRPSAIRCLAMACMSSVSLVDQAPPASAGPANWGATAKMKPAMNLPTLAPNVSMRLSKGSSNR